MVTTKLRPSARKKSATRQHGSLGENKIEFNHWSKLHPARVPHAASSQSLLSVTLLVFYLGKDTGIQVRQLAEWPVDIALRKVFHLGVGGNGGNVPLGDVRPIVPLGSWGDPASDLSEQSADDCLVGYSVLA